VSPGLADRFPYGPSVQGDVPVVVGVGRDHVVSLGSSCQHVDQLCHRLSALLLGTYRKQADVSYVGHDVCRFVVVEDIILCCPATE